MARNLTKEDKIYCFINNKLFISSTIKTKALQEIYLYGIDVFKRELGSDTLRVPLSFVRNNILEGALSLDCIYNGVQIYTTSFTFIPGEVVGLTDWQCLLISRMQGVTGRFEEFRRATRAMSDISPQALLLATYVGIAKAVGIKTIVGTSGDNQVNYDKGEPEHFYRAYDEFFQSVGARRLPRGFYAIDVPLPEKKLSEVKPGHRLRTRRKREIKADITRRTELFWRHELAAGTSAAPVQACVETPASSVRPIPRTARS